MGALAHEDFREQSERVTRALLGVELADEEPLEGEAFQRAATELVVGATLVHGGRHLIVFEDLHWCDQASLDLVRATTALVAEQPYVVVATFRPDPNAVSWGFKEWLERELADRTETIALEPLEGRESERLIDELLPGAELPPELRDRILERTEGNPLFVQEVVRSLVDAGALERAGEVLRLTDDTAIGSIPTTVQSLITVGFDRLPERTRRTLQTAAVIGRTFDEDVLRSVIGNGEVGGDLRELERRDLIRAVTGSPGEYTFRHALTQEAAYESLLVKHRREIHHRVAEGIEAGSADRLADVAALLVHHYVEAEDDEATLRFALLAGESARRLYANSEAAAHYRTAIDAGLRLGADSEVLRSAFGERGGSLEVAGRHHEAVAEYEEMRKIARERGDEAMELDANMALALLYGTPSPLFDPEVGRELSEENAVVARRLGDRAAEARALWNVVVSNIYGNGDDDRAVEAGEASLAIARELGAREQVAFTLQDVSRADMSRGDFPTAWERLSEARGIWEELGNVPMLGENLTASSLMRLIRGEHAKALEEARRAFAISEEIGNRWGASYALIPVYRIELDLGRVGDAIASIDRSATSASRVASRTPPSNPEPSSPAWWRGPATANGRSRSRTRRTRSRSSGSRRASWSPPWLAPRRCSRSATSGGAGGVGGVRLGEAARDPTIVHGRGGRAHPLPARARGRRSGRSGRSRRAPPRAAPSDRRRDLRRGGARDAREGAGRRRRAPRRRTPRRRVARALEPAGRAPGAMVRARGPRRDPRSARRRRRGRRCPARDPCDRRRGDARHRRRCPPARLRRASCGGRRLDEMTSFVAGMSSEHAASVLGSRDVREIVLRWPDVGHTA